MLLSLIVAVTVIITISTSCQTPSGTGMDNKAANNQTVNTDQAALPDGRIKIGRQTLIEAVDSAFLPENIVDSERSFYLYSDECYQLFISFSAFNKVEQFVFEIDRNKASDHQLAVGRQLIKDTITALLANVEKPEVISARFIEADLGIGSGVEKVMKLAEYKQMTSGSEQKNDSASLKEARSASYQGLLFAYQVDTYSESFLFSANGSLPGTLAAEID